MNHSLMIKTISMSFCLASLLFAGDANFMMDTMLYTSSKTATTAWRPMQGALAPQPAMVDGVRGLTLPCNFRPSTQRAIWEKDIDVDLTEYNYLYFRFKAPEFSAIGKVSIYLRSGDKGWYVCEDHAVVRLLTDQWMTALIPFKAFREEGKPAGWEHITKMRISIWQRKDIPTSVFVSDIRFQKINIVNLVNNSGFEYASLGRHPDYWGPGHWGLREGRWTAKMDQWRKTWRIDDTIAYQGKNSLRVVQSTDADILEHRVVSTYFPTAKKEPYTFSVWLKSDQPKGQQVELKIYTLKDTWIKKTFAVTNTWQRYQVGFTPKKTSARTRNAICPTTEGTLWIDCVQVEKGTTATTYQPAPTDITIIGHAVQNNEPAAADYPITAGSNQGTARIDAHRRFLVDGKPFIPTTVGWDKEPTPNAIRDLALSGFNTLCFTAYPSQTVASLHAIMDHANSLGLKVIQRIDNRVTNEQATRWVKGLKDHPALIAWYVYDEPFKPTSWEKANAQYKTVKALDDKHPVYINLLYRHLEGDYQSDILCLDYYPLTFWSPATVTTYVKKQEKLAAKAGKPSWIWLQNAGYAYFIFREPSDAEVQCMTYLSLIHGSRAIKYFAHQSLNKGLWDEMRRLTGEIKELTPILYSLEPQLTVSTTSPSINLVGKTYNGKKYVIAVNDLPSSVNATINISSSDKSATVLFEGRSVRVKGNQITDTFKAYQRHVYELIN